MPPENVELVERDISTQRHRKSFMRDHTGSHIPQRVSLVARSFRTNALVGSRRHLDPIVPGSYQTSSKMRAPSRRWWSGENMYELYPIAEIVTAIPLGIGSSVYTLPEVPTIGFVRGRTSSCTGARTISRAMG